MAAKIDPYEIRKKIQELAPEVADGFKAAAARAFSSNKLRQLV